MTDQVDALSPAGVSELANFIIRPPRATYHPADLGPKNFLAETTPAQRQDKTLLNSRGQTLQCSHYRPKNTPQSLPTVVFLHGNGSCRLEAAMLLHYVLPYRLSLFAFDFSGSGLSDGRYISLGVHEKLDVQTVVDHLISVCQVDKIILWGHSMGAATALMYAGLCSLRPQVKALVLDSPFASFDKLAQTMVAEMPIPFGIPRKLILTAGVRAVRKLVRDRANFDVMDIDPLSATRKIPLTLPVLFMHGSADAIVPLAHGRLLFKTYPATDKHFLQLNGLEHDAPRPESSMDRLHIFLQRHLIQTSPADLVYLDQLKARGNVAMLAGRFVDAIHLYTEALNALSQALTKLSFALAVGEPQGSIANTRSSNGLLRRNSSISSFVTTVKRWRHPRTVAPPSDDTMSRYSVASSHAPSRQIEQSRQNSALDASKLHAHLAHLETDSTQLGNSTVYPESALSSKSKSASALQFSKPSASCSGPEMRIRPETDLDKWPDDPSLPEPSRSESSGWSGRFGRRSSRAWPGRSVVQGLKKKLPFGRTKTTHTAPIHPATGTEERRPAGYGTPMERSVRSSPTNGRIIRDDDSSEGIDRALEMPTSSNNAFSKRPGSGNRMARSSSRVPMRHRGKRREFGRRVRAAKSADGDRRAERTWFGLDESKRRGLGTNGSNKKGRFSVGDSPLPKKESYMPRSETEDNILRSHGIASWNLDEEQKTIVLALLGNRSLARRKAKDINGALFDAITCLNLNPEWVRGYVRKAAALRELGKLGPARACVMEGLRQDPGHAGLTDMLRSIEIALEAEKLAKERAQSLQLPEVPTDVISGRA